MTTLPPLLVDAGSGPHGASVVSLRRHVEGDVERALEQCLDPESQSWTTVPLAYTLDDARSFVSEAMPGGWESDQEWAFAVDVDGRFGGTVSLRNEGNAIAEVAYGAHPDVRGTGAMERALRLLLAWGFDEQRLQTVIWRANRGNVASRRLAWKVGFRFEGTLRQWLPQRGELLDGWVGTLLATDPREPSTPWLDVPTIESPRLSLRLRPARESDLPRVVEGCRDPETTRWLGDIPAPYVEAHAADFVVRGTEKAACGVGLTLVAADGADDRLLAVIGLDGLDTRLGSGEVGYWAHPDARGRGVTTESLRLLLRHALLPSDDGGLGLVRVYAYAALDNAASRAVLTGAGMTEVGIAHRSTRTRAGMADAVLVEALAPPV